MSMLEGKVGLVTGGGMGIGRAICQGFAREGAKVVVADFNADYGLETVELIEQAGGEALFVKGDVSKEPDVKATVQAAVDTYGRLDIACNSAAPWSGDSPRSTGRSWSTLPRRLPPTWHGRRWNDTRRTW